MSLAPSARPVAVIDIGSNSIKSLVATRGAAGSVQPLHTETVEARISAGISRAQPRLSAEGIARGVAAVRQLLAGASRFAPEKTVLVATSAVRDAANGAEFREQVRAATGEVIRILSGDEEADLIGRGLTCDPALRALRDFYVFDLGGGSLECLAFRERRIVQAASLQLGCVRLTEKFVSDPAAPLPAAAAAAIEQHTQAELARSGFRFALPESAAAVGAGGTVSTVRAILGALEGKPFAATDPNVTVAQLTKLLTWLGALPLKERQQVAGLPTARADVFPAALATLLAIAQAGNLTAFRNSLYNLRYGLADETLSP